MSIKIQAWRIPDLSNGFLNPYYRDKRIPIPARPRFQLNLSTAKMHKLHAVTFATRRSGIDLVCNRKYGLLIFTLLIISHDRDNHGS
jgi:hypothetical protein